MAPCRRVGPPVQAGWQGGGAIALAAYPPTPCPPCPALPCLSPFPAWQRGPPVVLVCAALVLVCAACACSCPVAHSRLRADMQGERGAVICGGRPLKLRYAWPRSQVVSTSAGQGACPAAGWPAGGPSSAAVQTGPAEQSAEACAALGAPRHAAGQSGVPPAPVQPCCAGCGAPAEVVPLKRCSLCRAEWYCGGPCQLARWEAGHAAECGQLQQLAAVLAAPGPAALAPDLLKLLVAALQQPAGRQSRMVHEALRHAVPTAAQVAAAGT